MIPNLESFKKLGSFGDRTNMFNIIHPNIYDGLGKVEHVSGYPYKKTSCCDIAAKNLVYANNYDKPLYPYMHFYIISAHGLRLCKNFNALKSNVESYFQRIPSEIKGKPTVELELCDDYTIKVQVNIFKPTMFFYYVLLKVLRIYFRIRKVMPIEEALNIFAKKQFSAYTSEHKDSNFIDEHYEYVEKILTNPGDYYKSNVTGFLNLYAKEIL